MDSKSRYNLFLRNVSGYNSGDADMCGCFTAALFAVWERIDQSGITCCWLFKVYLLYISQGNMSVLLNLML